SAALVTMVVCLTTRAIMMYSVFPELTGGHQSGLDKYDEKVVEMLNDENLKNAGVEPGDAEDEEIEKAEKQTLAKLKGLSDTEYQALVKKAAEKEEIDELVEYKASEALQGKNPQNIGDA